MMTLNREAIYRVEDFQNERFQLVQSPQCVENLNEQYGVDYAYFFYEYESPYEDYPVALWGSDGCHMKSSRVEFVSQYI